MQLVWISGILLVAFIISSEQASIGFSSSKNGLMSKKRELDSQARAAIPLFRGSNLSMFIRKRPIGLFSERSVGRRQNIRSALSNDDVYSDEIFDSNDHPQRRFDEYSENPGPMFG